MITIGDVKQILADVLDSDPIFSSYMPRYGTDYLRGLRVENIGIIGHDSLYYSVFYELAAAIKPGLVVELGTWRGFGAAHFASGCKSSKILAIDIHREDKIAQQRVIDHTRVLDNISYINKWTWDAVHDVMAVGLPIDILFIDAWHEYQYAMREWELYKPLLADRALVICDDIFDAPGATVDMIKFWAALDKSQGITVKFLDVDIHNGVPMGFALFRRIHRGNTG
jgi:predicted O-methyltransferase YrrM